MDSIIKEQKKKDMKFALTPLGVKKTPLKCNLSVRPPFRGEIIETKIPKGEKKGLFNPDEPPQANPEQDKKLIGSQKYSDTQRIGCGSYGEVYLAKDQTTNQKVAIKLIYIPIDKIDEVIRELYVLGVVAKQNPDYLVHLEKIIPLPINMKHPYLRRLMIVLPLAEHGSLASGLSDLENLDDQTFAQMILQIFCGLKVLHDNGIVHNDIKPENVLLFDNGAKLADFGMITLKNTAFRRLSQYLMTWPYRAPEYLCTNDQNLELFPAPVSPAGDLWSMGIMLLELILYKFHSLFGMRVWEGNLSSEDWKVRMKKLLLAKGQDSNYVKTCLPHQTFPQPFEKLPSSADGLAILNAVFFGAPMIKEPKNSTEIYLLKLASHLLQINPKNRWTVDQVIKAMVKNLHLTPCNKEKELPTVKETKVDETGKDLLKALSILLHINDLDKLQNGKLDSKQIHIQLDQIARTYTHIVQNLHLEGKELTKQKARRGAFALAVLLHWGGLFAPYFLSNYSYLEFISLLDLENELISLLKVFEIQPFSVS